MGISKNDLEALTAYLDGELSGNDLKILEANLQADEELRKILEDLRRTRTIIRGLPSLRAPRNFYLTPAMVGETEKPHPAFPILRFASVFATLVLVLLFLGDMFVLPSQVIAPLRAMQIAEAPIEQAEQMEYEAETVEGQLPEVPAEEMMDRLEMEIEPALPEAEAMISPSVEPAPGLEKSMATELPAPAEESMDRLEMEAEPAAPEAEAMISPSIEPTPGLDKLLATELPAPAEAAEDVVGEAAESQEAPELRIETRESFSQPEVEPQPQINLRMIVRIGEITLIIIALSTGLAAFYLYLKNQ